MKGHVDAVGRALVAISLRQTRGGTTQQVEAWIDTGFNGHLVLPASQVSLLGLAPLGTTSATLADGSQVVLHRFLSYVDWIDGERELEVIANDGGVALLGVGLLVGFDLHISYRSGDVTIQ
jgi:clan AA aspartic protease